MTSKDKKNYLCTYSDNVTSDDNDDVSQNNKKSERKIMKKHLIATVNRFKLGHAVSSGFICEKIHFLK